MDKLLAILNVIKPGVDFQKSVDILGEGLLSSLDIMRLVTEIEEVYEVEIGIENMRPENFKNVSSILNMINTLKDYYNVK